MYLSKGNNSMFEYKKNYRQNSFKQCSQITFYFSKKHLYGYNICIPIYINNKLNLTVTSCILGGSLRNAYIVFNYS